MGMKIVTDDYGNTFAEIWDDSLEEESNQDAISSIFTEEELMEIAEKISLKTKRNFDKYDLDKAGGFPVSGEDL